jgi:hypothetical protein
VSYRPPELLGPSHVLDDFVCASSEQTDWLVRHGRQSMSAGTTRVFVVAPTDSDHVVAYYAWTMAQIAISDAPARLRKGAGRYPQPVACSHGSVSTSSTSARVWGRRCCAT